MLTCHKNDNLRYCLGHSLDYSASHAKGPRKPEVYRIKKRFEKKDTCDFLLYISGGYLFGEALLIVWETETQCGLPKLSLLKV